MSRKKKRRFERSFSKVELVRQALISAEASLLLARRLLNEVQGGPVPERVEIEGIVGIFDGKFMITEDGKKYQVPENYASKTQLVCGDKLKMIQEGDGTRFKQIDRVRRKQLEGILARKEGKPVVVTAEGSYEILLSALKHVEALEGDQLEILIPQDNKHVPFAALVRDKSRELRKAAESSEVKKEEKQEGKTEEKKEVKKESQKERKKETKVKAEKKEVRKEEQPVAKDSPSAEEKEEIKTVSEEEELR